MVSKYFTVLLINRTKIPNPCHVLKKQGSGEGVNGLFFDPLKQCKGVCIGPWLGLLNVYATTILQFAKKIMQLEGLSRLLDEVAQV